jgi:hypothetical protein
MNDEAFVARSRAAFAENFPWIMPHVEKSGISSSVVTENGVPTDIRIDGQLMYGGDAHRYTEGQVEAYMRKPLRFFVQRLDLSGIITAVGTRLIKRIEKGLREDEFGECTIQPQGSPTFLIVFGLGLGHHIAQLVRETKPRWLIIVEPLVELLESSFHVVDWEALVADFKERGGSIHISIETDPDRIINAISNVVLSKGVPYADGSWVYTHYPFWAFSEARDRLHEAMEFAFINRGFYEDELVMMRNAVANYAKHSFWLLEGRPKLRRPELAVIVGAGPSLDESIETLRSIRDRVVLFSAGTALRPLLRHGIVPDFHCELENVAAVYDVLSEAAKVGDISQITLMAAETVDPSLPTLFRDTVFYFRDSVSPTQILGRKHAEITGSGPTCVNTALMMATFLGFTDFVFFGTDCGTRPGSLRHAKGSVYEVGAYKAGNNPQAHRIKVEGNFGGTVDTEIIYNACRIMLGDGIKYFGHNVINCSDGALIEHTLPCVPEALVVDRPVIDRAVLRAKLEGVMRRYAPAELLEEADFGSVKQKMKDMYADLDALLVELSAAEPDFAAAYTRLMAFATGSGDKYAFTESIPVGSIQALPRIAMFYGYRLAEEDGRRRLYALFIREFRSIVEDMVQETSELFDKLEALIPFPQQPLLAKAG